MKRLAVLQTRIASRAGFFGSGRVRAQVCQNVSGRFRASIQNFFRKNGHFCRLLSLLKQSSWLNFQQKWLIVNYLVMSSLLRYQYPAVVQTLTHSVVFAFWTKLGFKNKSRAPARFNLVISGSDRVRASKWGPFTTLLQTFYRSEFSTCQ